MRRPKRHGAEPVYVLVRLNNLRTGILHFVPLEVVAKHVREEHAAWLASPGRDGKPHVENSMRTFRDPTDVYRDRWDLLGLD